MDYKGLIRIIPDFPKEGISFKDITTLLKDGEAWQRVVRDMAAQYKDMEIDLVVGPEARGFIIGAALAAVLGAGFIPVRKGSKLPAETIKGEYELEYGTDTLQMHRDAIEPGQRVLVVDDLLATGGTIEACIDMVESLGGKVAGIGVLIELTDLKGRERFSSYPVWALIGYPH